MEVERAWRVDPEGKNEDNNDGLAVVEGDVELGRQEIF